MKLLFEENISSNKVAFIEEVKNVSSRLNINPNWLMAVMYIETNKTFSSSIQNPTTRATGLIQFMPATAIDLGTTVEQLKRLSNVEQLKWVEKYYKRYRYKIKSYVDLYLATFFPVALDKPSNYVFETPTKSAYLIASQNPSVDMDKNGKITKAEFELFCYQKLPTYAWEIVKKKVQ